MRMFSWAGLKDWKPMLSANPGVNPSLTVMALTEDAMPRIPERTGLGTTQPRKHNVQASPV